MKNSNKRTMRNFTKILKSKIGMWNKVERSSNEKQNEEIERVKGSNARRIYE